MKTHCQKCGEKFTSQEMKKFIEEAQYCEVIFTCQDCYEMEGNYEQGERDFYSDADAGL